MIKNSIEKAENMSFDLIKFIDFIWNESIGTFNDLFNNDFTESNFFTKLNLEQVCFLCLK